jgi:hypothetical protein
MNLTQILGLLLMIFLPFVFLGWVLRGAHFSLPRFPARRQVGSPSAAATLTKEQHIAIQQKALEDNASDPRLREATLGEMRERVCTCHEDAGLRRKCLRHTVSIVDLELYINSLRLVPHPWTAEVVQGTLGSAHKAIIAMIKERERGRDHTYDI